MNNEKQTLETAKLLASLPPEQLDKLADQLDGGALMYGDYRKGLPELIEDREAIRAELKASRQRHTVRVRSILP